jgi:hypothetical protein
MGRILFPAHITLMLLVAIYDGVLQFGEHGRR